MISFNSCISGHDFKMAFCLFVFFVFWGGRVSNVIVSQIVRASRRRTILSVAALLSHDKEACGGRR